MLRAKDDAGFSDPPAKVMGGGGEEGGVLCCGEARFRCRWMSPRNTLPTRLEDIVDEAKFDWVVMAWH